MHTEKEASLSDTLDRSNLSSLQSDSAEKKSSELANVNLKRAQHCYCTIRQYNLDNIQFVPCPGAAILNSKFDPITDARQCYCQTKKGDSQRETTDAKGESEWQRFNWKWPRQNFAHKTDKSYGSKFKNKRAVKKPLARCESPAATSPAQQNDVAEKMDIYYFDHGNSSYYHTTDVPPALKTERLAEKSSSAAVRLWAELFGYAHIAVSLITAGLLQSLRCLLFSLARPLTVGTIQLVADYFIKPLLSITFNGLVQPALIMLYNVATSVRDCCEPIAAALGFFTREVALLLRSCRLVEINHHYHRSEHQ